MIDAGRARQQLKALRNELDKFQPGNISNVHLSIAVGYLYDLVKDIVDELEDDGR